VGAPADGDDPVILDGAMGEGGGQILRSALALSLVTGRALRIDRIRARRRKPGLLHQHLAAVEAARVIGRAEVRGARLGSSSLEFRPRGLHPGDYAFSLGTAGSTTLVIQAVLPALMVAEAPATLAVEGGTHNPSAPPFEFLDRSFLPIVRRSGARVAARLVRRGFHPAGGGRVEVAVRPPRDLAAFDFLERGPTRARRAVAVVSRLPLSIARRELDELRERLGLTRDETRAEETHDSPGAGNVVILELRSDEGCEVITGFGRRGVRAEAVASGVADEAERFERSGAAAGEHLADQLLLPMAIAGGGAIRTVAPSSHTRTHLEVIRAFVDVRIDIAREADDRYRIEIRREGAGP